tara:strand:+ start:36096 stop:37400 length:1305 start_codon:yes stop_codon:yes gene_type:complete
VTAKKEERVTTGKLPKGEMETLIESFHTFERPLFNSLVDEDGFAWWDLVRYDIQFEILYERGLRSRATNPQRQGLRPTISALRRGAAVASDLAALPRLLRREVDAIIVSRRPLEPILKVIEESDTAHFILGSPEFGEHGSLSIDKYHIDLLINLVARLLLPSAGLLNHAKRVERDFQEYFDIQMPVYALIEAKYRKHLAAKRIWSRILSLPASLRRVVFVNDDTMKTLVWLCNQRGIDTTEVQHGYMGSSHIGFSYPQLDKSLMTMPNRVMITRDTGDITYPAPLLRFEGAATVTAVPSTGDRDIDVLIGSGPRWGRRTEELVAALANSGMRVAVKLHPAQTREDLNLDFEGVQHKPEVFGGKDAFLPIVRRARVYVPVNPGSTTSFEAVENGCVLVLYQPHGAPSTSVVNHLAAANTSDPNEFVACIRDSLDP